MKIAIVGAGVVGTAVGILLRRANHEIVAISSRTLRSARAAASAIGGGAVVSDPGTAALGADVVLLAVPDRAIPAVAIEIASGGALRRGATVAHFSGALPAGVLSGVRAAGGWQGALHPLQSLADVETAVTTIPGSYFFLDGDAEALDTLRALVTSLDARAVHLPASAKALYHAAAATASNHLVALVDAAVATLRAAGVPDDAALPALLPLIQGTVRNLRTVGLPQALTGPIERGDVGTVRGHLAALAAASEDLLAAYVPLARRAVDLALRKGSIDRRTADELCALLAGSTPKEPSPRRKGRPA